MKKIYGSFLAAILILLASCGGGNNAVVSVKVTGWEQDTVIVYQINLTNNNVHTTKVVSRNGKITFALPEDVTELKIIRQNDMQVFGNNRFRLESKTLTLVTRPGEGITVTGGEKDGMLLYKIAGSELSEKIEDFNRTLRPYYQTWEEMDQLIQSKQGSPSITLLDSIKAEQVRIAYITRTYIRKNKNDILSGYLLLSQPDPVFSEYYPQLSEEVRNGMLKTALENKQNQLQRSRAIKERAKVIQPGAAAPDLVLTDINGHPFRLSEFDSKGKYVVFDFWGSWCGYCIQGFPRMREYYEKYGDRLEIIGIACKDKEEDWRKAVREQGLTWIQLVNSEEPEKDATLAYAVKAYPTKVILAPDKTIVEVVVGEKSSFYHTLSRLLD